MGTSELILAGPDALLNQRVCKITVRTEAYYSQRFLRWVLPGYLDAVHRSTSSVTVKHLSSETVKELPIPLPPRPEQERIVAAIEEQFSRLDAGIAALERARHNLVQMRAAILGSTSRHRDGMEFHESRWVRSAYEENGDMEPSPRRHRERCACPPDSEPIESGRVRSLRHQYANDPPSDVGQVSAGRSKDARFCNERCRWLIGRRCS